MIDIVSSDSEGMVVYDTEVEKAKNLINVQLGSLEYAPSVGIDLRYFLSEDIRFQNESFQAYLIQVLASKNVNVARFLEVFNSLSSDYIINLSPSEQSTGMVAR